MNNQVTIVIPTFNRAHLLPYTVESALAQTEACDIIVCDHGSKDNTSEIMKKYEGRVKYIRRDTDFGPHFCWLEGVLHSKTEFVHIHFDDDVMDSTFVEETLALMSDDVGMVITEAKVVDLDTKEEVHSKLFNLGTKYPTGIHPSVELETLLLNGMMFSPACCLYRKKELIDGLYQGDLPLEFNGTYHGVGPDHFFSFLAVLHYPKFGFVDKPLAVFGAHDASITIDAIKDVEKQKRIANAYESVRSYYKLLKTYGINSKMDVQAPIQSSAQSSIQSDFKQCLKSLERALQHLLKALKLRKKEVRS